MSAFDWVTARSECSLSAVFEKLRSEIKQDVETREGLLKSLPTESRYYAIQFTDNGPSSFTVIVEGRGVSGRIRFEQADRSIKIEGSEGYPSFEATLTLNAERECRLRIKEQEYETWQVRKMALEKMFFEPPRRSASQM